MAIGPSIWNLTICVDQFDNNAESGAAADCRLAFSTLDIIQYFCVNIYGYICTYTMHCIRVSMCIYRVVSHRYMRFCNGFRFVRLKFFYEFPINNFQLKCPGNWTTFVRFMHSKLTAETSLRKSEMKYTEA